jgi:hypothetical protein
MITAEGYEKNAGGGWQEEETLLRECFEKEAAETTKH